MHRSMTVMNLETALRVILPQLSNELVVHANGYISRLSYALADRAASFYMIGSMGLASSIGLGLALVRPERRVIVFDGDGNVLMNLGSLAMTAAVRPRNFLHICFDNAAYASTGGQRTISDRVRLEEMARAAGYRDAARVETPEALDQMFSVWLREEGPRFLLARIGPDVDEHSLPRVDHQPAEIAARFRDAACRP